MSPLDVLLRDAIQRESDLRAKVGCLELAADADSSLTPELTAVTAAYNLAVSDRRRLEGRAALAHRTTGRAA